MDEAFDRLLSVSAEGLTYVGHIATSAKPGAAGKLKPRVRPLPVPALQRSLVGRAFACCLVCKGWQLLYLCQHCCHAWCGRASDAALRVFTMHVFIGSGISLALTASFGAARWTTWRATCPQTWRSGSPRARCGAPRRHGTLRWRPT